MLHLRDGKPLGAIPLQHVLKEVDQHWWYVTVINFVVFI